MRNALLMLALLAAPCSADDLYGLLGGDEPRPIGPSITAEPITAEPVAGPAPALSRPLSSVTIEAAAPAELAGQMEKLPEGFAILDRSRQRFGSWDEPSEDITARGARFAGSLYTWAAPAVYHRPLYFEQPNLERYGHHVRFCRRDNLTQSAISAAHFFAVVPVLPYKIGSEGGQCACFCDYERNYVLGAYRPGSCNPNRLLKPTCSARGLLFQGVATTGLVYLLP